MIIAAENLGKRYNREWIFRNLTFTFEPGVYAITGPNGSGKSTLLQVLWGQLPSSSGALRYRKDSIEIPIEEIHQQLAIVAPYMELIEEFTLMEVLQFHFSFKRIRENKRPEDLAEVMELSHVRNKTISQFSSGMKQRVRLGLAFYSDVDLLFLDEPTTNLDKNSIDWYWRNFNQIVGKTSIFVGSNLENEYPADAKKIRLPDYK